MRKAVGTLVMCFSWTSFIKNPQKLMMNWHLLTCLLAVTPHEITATCTINKNLIIHYVHYSTITTLLMIININIIVVTFIAWKNSNCKKIFFVEKK